MYPLTVYHHTDAVIICCGWNPNPPHILESDKVTFCALNYIIAISKLTLFTCRDGGCFLGENSRSGGHFCQHKQFVSWIFLPATDAVFWAEIRLRIGRTGRRTDASPHTVVFFSSYWLTATVTTLHLFGLVCLVGHFSSFCCEWGTCVDNCYRLLHISVPGGLVVRIRRSHRRGPGSIPGQGTPFYVTFCTTDREHYSVPTLTWLCEQAWPITLSWL